MLHLNICVALRIHIWLPPQVLTDLYPYLLVYPHKSQNVQPRPGALFRSLSVAEVLLTFTCVPAIRSSPIVSL